MDCATLLLTQSRSVRVKYKDRLGLQLLSGLQADFGLGKLYPSRNAE